MLFWFPKEFYLITSKTKTYYSYLLLLFDPLYFEYAYQFNLEMATMVFLSKYLKQLEIPIHLLKYLTGEDKLLDLSLEVVLVQLLQIRMFLLTTSWILEGNPLLWLKLSDLRRWYCCIFFMSLRQAREGLWSTIVLINFRPDFRRVFREAYLTTCS